MWKHTSRMTQEAVFTPHSGSAVKKTKQWYTSGMTMSTTIEMKNSPQARIWSLHLSAAMLPASSAPASPARAGLLPPPDWAALDAR